jgi:gliding motility-associated-like protein
MGGETTATGSNLTTSFDMTGTWNVKLSTTYTDGAGCFEKDILVSAQPSYTLDNSGSDTKCPSESVVLSFSESDIVSYSWDDDNSSSGPLTVSEPGTYTATYITDTGCEIVAPSITISNFPGLGLEALDGTIENDTIQLADGQLSVQLRIANSSTDIAWTIDGVNAGSNPTLEVSPSNPTAVVSVTATTADNCLETASVVVISGSFTPRESFSPNGDGLNDCWEILNSSILDDCTVYILDSRGSVIYEATGPFVEDCVWDGSANGKQVPEGVYYFVLKCSNSSDSQTGAILLAR